MKAVQTNAAPAAIGPYSQAMITGNLVFTSGQIPLSPETGEISRYGNNRSDRAGLQKPESAVGGLRLLHYESRKNHLLPCGYERFCRF